MKAITIFLILIICTIAVSCSDNTTQSDNQTSIYPQEFSTIGNMIVDESNNEIIFKGVSIESPIVLSHSLDDKASNGIFYFDQYLEWNETIFRNISNFGANIVRLPIYPAALNVHGMDNSLLILDEAINWAAKYNMYVILDYHSIGFPTTGDYESNIAEGYGELYTTTQQEILNFWSVASERYKNNKTVAFYELFNEPVYPSFATSAYTQQTTQWNNWKTFAEEIIDTIRNHDANSSVIVGGLNWAYDLSYLTLNSSNAVNRVNVIYAVHPYPGAIAYMDSTVTDWDMVFGTVSQNYPIFATEIGFLLDNPNEAPYYEGLFVGDGLYRDALKAYLIDKRISWTAWCYSPYTWPKLLNDKNYSMTEAGRFINTWMLEENN